MEVFALELWRVFPQRQESRRHRFLAVNFWDSAFAERQRRSALIAPAEVIIHAGANDVLLHRDIVARQGAATGAIEAAEVDAQIFRFGGPVAGQREFDA